MGARALLAWTGERRWEEAWPEAPSSCGALGEDGPWTQRLYGNEEQRGPAGS